MSNEEQNLQRAEQNLKLYRSNELVISGHIHEFHLEIDTINTDERKKLQNLEQNAIKKRELLEKNRLKLQDALQKLQSSIQDLQKDTYSESEKIQQDYSKKRDTVTRKIRDGNATLAATRREVETEMNNVRKAQEQVTLKQNQSGGHNGRPNHLSF